MVARTTSEPTIRARRLPIGASDGTWGGESYVKASNTGAGIYSGMAVAISSSGTPLWDRRVRIAGRPESTVIRDAGANTSGASYVFVSIPTRDADAAWLARANGFADTVADVDRTAPTLRVRGRKTIETLRKRVVIRGTARDDSGISRVIVKARGAKVKKTRYRGNGSWKTVLKVRKNRRRVIVRVVAVDGVGNRSGQSRVRILRR